MSMDAMHSLRKLDFPECTKAAMDQLNVCYKEGHSAIPGLGDSAEEIAEQLVTELVFFQTGPKAKYVKLTATRELQVLQIINSHMEKQQNEWTRNMIFKALFETSLEGQKLRMLCKLVSLGVGLQNKPLLDAVAVWMQALGCASEAVIEVVRTISEDYCVWLPAKTDCIKHLAKLSPHFTCNYITALTTVYQPAENNTSKKPIPHQLLEILAEWMSEDNGLCLVSLSHAHNTFAQRQRNTLWTSPTKPAHHTPIPGLIRWCTKVPVLQKLCSNGETSSPDSKEIEKRLNQLWANIHLSVLQTLVLFQTVPGATQLELVTLADMNKILKDVIGLVHMIPGRMEVEQVQIAVERLVQLLQVTLATGAFRCSMTDLQSICQQIPPNKLLDILQSQHLSRVPPPMHHELR